MRIQISIIIAVIFGSSFINAGEMRCGVYSGFDCLLPPELLCFSFWTCFPETQRLKARTRSKFLINNQISACLESGCLPVQFYESPQEPG